MITRVSIQDVGGKAEFDQRDSNQAVHEHHAASVPRHTYKCILLGEQALRRKAHVSMSQPDRALKETGQIHVGTQRQLHNTVRQHQGITKTSYTQQSSTTPHHELSVILCSRLLLVLRLIYIHG
jgi:hypothetical protein